MTEEASGNGRVTIREVYGLLEKVYARIDVVAAKGETNHRENIKAINTLGSKLEEHLIEARGRDEKIASLQQWRAELPSALQTQLQVLLTAEHDKITREHNEKHENHLDRDHDEGREFLASPRDELLTAAAPSDDQELGAIRTTFRFSKWVVGLVVAAAITSGMAATINSCYHSSQSEKDIQQLKDENAAIMKQNQEMMDFLQLVEPDHSDTVRGE